MPTLSVSIVNFEQVFVDWDRLNVVFIEYW